jgi:hypothetical protein
LIQDLPGGNLQKISTGDGNGNCWFAVDQAAFLACNLRVKG